MATHYSILAWTIPRTERAWWTIIRWVAKGQTQLSTHTHTHTHTHFIDFMLLLMEIRHHIPKEKQKSKILTASVESSDYTVSGMTWPHTEEFELIVKIHCTQSPK